MLQFVTVPEAGSEEILFILISWSSCRLSALLIYLVSLKQIKIEMVSGLRLWLAAIILLMFFFLLIIYTIINLLLITVKCQI